MEPLTVDRLVEADWAVLRELRLAALADAPYAFWARLEDEAANTEAEWTSFVRGVVWLVARRAGQPVGLAGGLRRPETPDEPDVIGMWVAPPERNRGVGARLLEGVCAWAFEESADVYLWVADGNEQARRLYEQHGFRPTGEHADLPPGPNRPATEARMRRSSTP